jgi:hypothetical protein
MDHRARCKDGSCTGPGGVKSNAAATAMALLPFLAAGQTHESRGPYQKTVYAGINWMIRNQKPTGDLSTGGEQQMYTHGLATITLCEAYGMTQDKRLLNPAQAAVRFIESGQNSEGGWRYTHGCKDSDTSVFGWQVMGLKSGLMAGLSVNHGVLDKAKGFLSKVSSGDAKGQFGYEPGKGATNVMTSVGLLTLQYMGAKRDEPRMKEGVALLMKSVPAAGSRNVYYWYYATQVMHNISGPDWDKWNREMRRALIDTQAKESCASGSWDPVNPSKDPWGDRGGRIMMTALSALSIEVYYRYLPLYKESEGSGGAVLAELEAASAPAKAAEAPKAGAAPKAGEKKAAEAKPGEKKAADAKPAEKKADAKPDAAKTDAAKTEKKK